MSERWNERREGAAGHECAAAPLELGGDLRALRGLTLAGAAAAHAGPSGVEVEAAEHRRASVALERGDGLVLVRLGEGKGVPPRPPHAVVDLTLVLARLVPRPGRVEGAARH